MLERIGGACAQHHRRVVLVWLVAIVALGVAAQVWGGTTRDAFTIPGTNSQQAMDLLDDAFPTATDPALTVVVEAPAGTRVTDAGPAAAIEATASNLSQLPGAGTVSDPVATAALSATQISPDGTITFLTVPFTESLSALPDDLWDRAQAATAPARDAGLTVAYGGVVADQYAAQGGISQWADEIGLAVALVILLVSLDSVVAALVPIGVAVFAVSTATHLTSLLESVVEVGTAGPILGQMIGLGVGIDYSLFILSRHRSELRRGASPVAAVRTAVATSGSAVLFAAITVCLALGGLALVGVPYVTTLGLVAALYVVVTVVTALTLLPAVLGWLGPHVDALALRRSASARAAAEGAATDTTLSGRWARLVVRRAWPFAVLGLVIMVVLALPVRSIDLGFTDDGDDPADTTQRQAYDLLTRGFGPGANGPLLVAVRLTPQGGADGQATLAAAEGLSKAIAATPGVASASPPIPDSIAGLAAPSSPGGTTTTLAGGTTTTVSGAALLSDYEQAFGTADAAIIQVVPSSAPNTEQTQALVTTLRDDVIPKALVGTAVQPDDVSVGGLTAVLIDLTDAISARLPLFIGAVVTLTFLLLAMVFRSLVIPLNAAVMNLLSIGAAYGILVVVFQWGWGREVIGLSTTVPVVAFVPVMMFAVLFGLSMDYEVFLLSRIREEYLRLGDSRESIVEGLARTARVITSAALIMISVFLAFVTNVSPTVKMIGLGMAVAVLLDASVVRMLLVPSTLSLTSRANWWLPRWLDRVLPHVALEAAPAEPAPADAAGAGAS